MKENSKPFLVLTRLVAVGERISLGSLRTAANGAVLLGQTMGRAGAGRGIQAGIDAVATAAGFRVLALIVRRAALVSSGFCGEEIRD